MMRKIVSLTSYGARLSKTLPTTLESIYSMNGFEPDCVLLYLTESDYELLDKNLLLKYNGLSVRIVDDIKSYKKYYVLTEKEFDDDLIFVADDDICYDSDTWIKLFSLYENNNQNKCVYASNIWVYKNDYSIASLPKENKIADKFLISSGYGLLIPPKILRFDNNLLQEWFEYKNKGGLNYINDDVFLSVYCLKNDVKCVCACIKQQFLDFENNQKFSNALRGKTKYQTRMVLKYFDMPCDNIVVSLSINDVSKIYDRINSLFEGQTLKPDKVVLVMADKAKLPNKVLNLQKKYNFEIQYTDLNPAAKKWNPEGLKDDDLLIVVDGNTNYSNDLLMSLYFKYSSNVLTLGRKIAFFENYGHQYILFDKCSILRAKSIYGVDCAAEGDFMLKATETILRNGFFVKPY